MSVSVGRNSPGNLGWVWAFLGTFVLLLPSIEPLFDHHFAERQPDHQHIYLGRIDPDHSHPYQDHHTHDHPHRTSDLARHVSVSAGPSGGSDIVYLTSQHGLAHSVTSVIVPAVPVRTVYPDLGDHWSLFSLASGDGMITEAFIPPPDKPPRS